ncbi:serine hydrolase domain-containing protein [Spirosoma migulaei]
MSQQASTVFRYTAGSLWIILCCGGSNPLLAQNHRVKSIENSLILSATINGRNGDYSLDERMSYYGVPGVSLAVLDQDSLCLQKGYGFADREGHKQITPSTLFQAASVSKSITAVAVMKLVEGQKLSLDNDVNQYLRNWQIDYGSYPPGTFVSLRQLLSHTAGLSVSGFSGYVPGVPLPGIVQILTGTPPANNGRVQLTTRPGEKWAYSGGGYTVIQKIIEDVLQTPYAQAIDSLVLKPLSMSNSFFNREYTYQPEQQVAVGYDYGSQRIPAGWNLYPELAAAGLWTTPTDILSFIRALAQSLAGKPKSYLSRTSADLILEEGLGFFVDSKTSPTMFSFRGTNRGYRCEFIGFTQNNHSYGAMVMANSYNSRYLLQEILRSIAAQYGWRYPFAATPKDISVVNVSGQDLDKLIGTFRSATSNQIISIERQGGMLQGTQQWDNYSFSLQALSEHRFINPSSLQQYDFSLDSNGKVHELRVDNKMSFIKATP